MKTLQTAGITVHSVTSNSSAFSAGCTHFAKIMQNGAEKLVLLAKTMPKILAIGVGVKSNQRDTNPKV